MSSRAVHLIAKPLFSCLMTGILIVTSASTSQAQFRNSAVGGVSITSDGVVAQPKAGATVRVTDPHTGCEGSQQCYGGDEDQYWLAACQGGSFRKWLDAGQSVCQQFRRLAHAADYQRSPALAHVV